MRTVKISYVILIHVLSYPHPLTPPHSHTITPSTAVNKAYKMLEDEEQVQYAQGVLEEAKATLEQKVPPLPIPSHHYTRTPCIRPSMTIIFHYQ